MKNTIKKLAALSMLAASILLAPVTQSPAQALGAGLQSTADKADAVTAVHYRYYQHYHRHSHYHRYHRRHHHWHHRHHHHPRVYIRLYL